MDATTDREEHVGGEVGGDTRTVHDGGAALTALAGTMSARSTDVHGAATSASGAAGAADAQAALARFAAAGSTMCTDLGTQLKAGGTLATNASKDLDHAGGER